MYIARGWPLLVCHPQSKAPIGRLVPNGVHSATTDLERIAAWLRECPEANWAVACGAPGPQVLDLDYPDRAPAAVVAAAQRAPRARSYRTERSGHAYFTGTDAGTVVFDWGELRGVGSYAMVPPSIHPSGESYLWIAEPSGPLPPVPVSVPATGKRSGCGEYEQPPKPIIEGEGRHEHLEDFALRLLRGGITDRRTIEVHLRCEFELSCAPLPPPRATEFSDLAKWATGSRIAERERNGTTLGALVLGDAGLRGRP
jgi:hypothetical protein